MSIKANILKGKTPVTLLQEICQKESAAIPSYAFLGEASSSLGVNQKTFTHRATAMAKSATGVGRSKQDSKHEAAWQLICLLLGIPTDEDDDADGRMTEDGGNLDTGDKVMLVRDICVQRCFPLPEFNLVRNVGPSHAPLFEYECRIRDIVRRGTHTTKKGAKQAACSEMIKTLQALPVEETCLQLQTIDLALKEASNEDEQVVRTYREYSQSANKKKLGVTIADRHDFFMSLPEARIAEALAVMADTNETLCEKCHRIPQALNLKYAIQLHDSNTGLSSGGYLSTFELINPEYDCLIMGVGDELYNNVFRYFSDMLNFTQVC
ncbi:RISC-loading complex subunit tarbp2 [Anopheles bellator]|uniref:RISC-loading complex subunit tarbp2 n=1 Tax=Anopheles bellator TaxID=139047 RepID=UPI0026479BE2|nr:RISC-loading complex subunit tarbp2 [Anopheles bellator]